MRHIFIYILSMWLLAPIADAVPPPPPTRADLVKSSDVIAIVNVTKVDGRKIRKGKSEFWELCATANVERVLKGSPDDRIVVAYDEWIGRSVCRAPSLSEGRFLIFLQNHGAFFRRTDDWYGQHRIVGNQVRWELNHPQELKAAIREIEQIAEKGKN